MARTVSTFRIGMFALICLGLIIGTAIWLKAAFWFEKTKTYAAYFNVSVNGLHKDAPISYMGVPVGRIEKLTIAPDGRLIEVLMKLKDSFRVDNTICAQLHVQGLTGLRYLEIDPAPQDLKSLTPHITFVSRYPVIRSYPSEIDVLQLRLGDLYAKFTSLNLQGLANSWEKTSALFNNILLQLGARSPEGGDLKATIVSLKHASQNAEALFSSLSRAASPERVNKGVKDLRATLVSTRDLTQRLDKQLATLPPGTLKHLSDQLDKTLQSGNAAFSDMGNKINNSVWLLDNDLRQLGELIAQLKSFTRSISREPNSLIFPVKQPSEPFNGK
ncbi:MAG: MlaD family protein [Deltaproteobacteria bacterium]|nr:MlaD family protein [Deltaproteobacteria bacterium]MDA8306619.1 MlaD family protein [Deltaproteobacteria bacterium]